MPRISCLTVNINHTITVKSHHPSIEVHPCFIDLPFSMELGARKNCSETEPQPMTSESSDGFVDFGLPMNDSLDYDEWVSLISEIERSHPNDGKKISLVYDSFLSKFPLCYGYWRKYASHMTRLCTVDRVVEIFEQAVQSATYVVDVWVDYCSFSMLAFEDPSDTRRLFRRAVYFVGKDYLCYSLWDKYIEFELSQQNWNSLTLLCIQTLQFPTKRLHQYYESFKKLVDHFEEDFSCQAGSTMEIQPQLLQDGKDFVQKEDEMSAVVKDLLDVSDNCTSLKALHTYKTMGERYYKNSCQLDKKVSSFEAHIRRPYFHVKPLDATQLENWHHYLDFAETSGDFDWVIKLYERCLIPCANYPEYWLRYVDFMEAKGGREIANHALHRATETFLKKMPAVHLFNAMFKEQIGDLIAARASFISSGGEMDSVFIKNVIRRANMEKRLGNTVEAFNILKHALDQAEIKEMSQDISVLYIHFSRLKYMTTNDVEASRDILVNGIRKFPYCKLLLEELIKFSMFHGASNHIDVVDSVITDAISSGPTESRCLKEEDAEDISTLYLEFVDLCGTIHDVRKAWNRHLKLFPDTIRAFSRKDLLRITSPKLPKLRMEDTPTTILRCPSADVSSDCLSKQQPSSDERISAPIYTNEQPDLVLRDHVTQQLLQTKKSDDCSQGKRTLSPQVSEPATCGAPEEKISVELIPHYVCAGSFSAERLVSLSNVEDENSDKIKNLQPLLGTSSKDVHTQKKYEHVSEKGENAFPLQSSYLDSYDELSVDRSPSTYHACETSREMCKSARSTPDRSTSDSAHYKNQDWSVSESGPKQFQVKTCNRSWTKLTHDGQQWHQRNNTDRSHRGSRSQFHSHPYRKHDQRIVSQQQKHGQVGAQKLSTQGNSSLPPPMQQFQIKQPIGVPYQLEGRSSNNPEACQGWPVSTQQQNLPSFSESPAQPVVSLAQENPVQASCQYGPMQNTEAYNQMWQYYYYQQQQFLLQQQQWQLHQHHQLPQQPLYQQEQLRQQPPQQQYIQSEQSFQPEQLQHLQPHQNQQGNTYQQLIYQQQHSQSQQFPLQQQPQQQQDIPYIQQQIQLQQHQLMQPQTRGQQEEPELERQKQQSTPADCQSLNVEEIAVPKESGSTGIVAASANPQPSDMSPPK